MFQGGYAMKNAEITSKIQRRCLLDPNNNGCEKCEMSNCPYIYCEKMDCLNCTLRMMCPMCEGDCTKCKYHAMCVIAND